MAECKLYCWAASEEAERWHGPFNTPEEAREDWDKESDKEYYYEGHGFVLGEAEYPDPGDFAVFVTDLRDLIEMMDERAVDSEFFGEGPIFEVSTDEKTARESLESLMRKWAEEHIEACLFVARPIKGGRDD